MPLRPEQSKIARGLLGWTQERLAKAVGLPVHSIDNFEKGQAIFRRETLDALEDAYESVKIEFPDEYTVKRHSQDVTIIKGYNALNELWADIFEVLKDGGGEVLITNVDEKRALDIEQKNLTNHLEKLRQSNITERLLSCEGDTNFLMPVGCYRWLPEDLFSLGTSTYIYQGKVAHQVWGDELMVIIKSAIAYESEKRRFEYLWKLARIPEAPPTQLPS